MFKLATSTNLLSFNQDRSKTEMVNLIPKLKMLGYENLDLNFCEMMNPVSTLISDKGEEYLSTLLSYKDIFKVNYVQSHVPYTQDYLALSKEKQNKLDELITKAISYSALLNIDTVVIHPIKGDITQNLHYFERVLKQCPSTIKLAIENMDKKDELWELSTLITLIKELKCKNVGLCLDTGHANLNYERIEEEIERLGDYLIATHIADNHGVKDEHLMPYFGTICWEKVIKAFNAISYEQYLTYEVMFFTSKLPQELKEKAALLGLDILNYFVSIAR